MNNFKRWKTCLAVLLSMIICFSPIIPIEARAADGPPTVATYDAKNITSSTAAINGEVTAYGGGLLVTEYGFYWGTGTSTSNKFKVGNQISKFVPFSAELRELNPGRKYYFKAYAKNAAGESKGSLLSFTTESLPSPSVSINSPGYNAQFKMGENVTITGSGTNCHHIGLFIDGGFINGSVQNGNNYYYNYQFASSGTHTITLVGRNTPGENDPGTKTAENSIKIVVSQGAVEPPVFNPTGGTYSSPQNVSINCQTNGVIIRYTTDGSEPTSSSARYSSPILINKTTIIKAKAFKSGMTDSVTISSPYIIDSPAPSVNIISPNSSTQYKTGDTLAVIGSGTNCDHIGLFIDDNFVNGSVQNGNNYYYNYRLAAPGTHTIKLVGRNTPGENDPGTKKAEASVKITVSQPAVEPPVFNPSGCTFTSPQNISIRCQTSGAVIRYTTNGSEPTETSPQYSAPILINSNTVIKAKAFKSGMTESITVNAAYNFTGESLKLFSADILSPALKNNMARITQGSAVNFKVITSSDITKLFLQTEGDSPYIEEITNASKSPSESNLAWTFKREITGVGTRSLKFYGQDKNGQRTSIISVNQPLVVDIDAAKWSISYNNTLGTIEIRQTGGASWNESNCYKLYIKDLSSNTELFQGYSNKTLLVSGEEGNPELYNDAWSVISDLDLVEGRKYEIGVAGTAYPDIVQQAKITKTIEIPLSSIKIYSIGADKQTVEPNEPLNFEVVTSSKVTRLELYAEGVLCDAFDKNNSRVTVTSINSSQSKWKISRPLQSAGLRKIQFRPIAGSSVCPLSTLYVNINVRQSSNNFIYYAQNDPKWSWKDFDCKLTPEYNNIGNSGCGPVSMSMVVATFKNDSESYAPDGSLSPVSFALDGYRRKHDQGPELAFFTDAADKYSIKLLAKYISPDGDPIGASRVTSLESYLDGTDNMAIASMNAGHFTTAGHYIVLCGFRIKDGISWFKVMDPNSRNARDPNSNNKKRSATWGKLQYQSDFDFTETAGEIAEGKAICWVKSSVIAKECKSYWVYSSGTAQTDTQPPVVTISAPASGKDIPRGTQVNISATATDNKVVKAMALYIDSDGSSENQKSTSTSNGFLTYPWDTSSLTPGTHTILIQAWDGKNTGKNQITVNITPAQTVDKEAPKIVSTNPIQNSTDMAAYRPIAIVFGEPIKEGDAFDKITLQGSNSKATSFTKNISENTLSIVPSNSLEAGIKYTVTIPTNSIKDMSGNGLALKYTLIFTCSKVQVLTGGTVQPRTGYMEDEFTFTFTSNSDTQVIRLKSETGEDVEQYDSSNATVVNSANYTKKWTIKRVIHSPGSRNLTWVAVNDAGMEIGSAQSTVDVKYRPTIYSVTVNNEKGYASDAYKFSITLDSSADGFKFIAPDSNFEENVPLSDLRVEPKNIAGNMRTVEFTRVIENPGKRTFYFKAVCGGTTGNSSQPVILNVTESAHSTLESAREVAKNITAWYESSSSCWVSGNFDGQGMSIGYFQWNFGQSNLQPMLRDMRDKYGSELDSIFDFKSGNKKGYEILREKISPISTSEQIAWADSITDTKNKQKLIEPWYSAFIKLVNNRHFIEIQNEYAKDKFEQADQISDWMQTLGIEKTARSYALALDIAVQNGPGIFLAKPDNKYYQWSQDMKNLITDTINEKDTVFTNKKLTVYPGNKVNYPDGLSENQNTIIQDMKERLTKISDPYIKKLYYVAAAASISEVNFDQWTLDVWKRKSTIVQGNGKPRGGYVDFVKMFGLNDNKMGDDSKSGVQLASLKTNTGQISVVAGKSYKIGGNISITGIYSDGSRKDLTYSNTLIWQIADNSIARLPNNGTIVGVTPKATTLTVSCQNQQAKITVNVLSDEVAALAQQILQNSNIALLEYEPAPESSAYKYDGASAKDNITDTANGKEAKRSSYGNAKGGTVSLNADMLRAILSLADKYKFRITSIAGGSHSVSSQHYNGVAFDIDMLDGQPFSKSSRKNEFVSDAIKLYGASFQLIESTCIHIDWR